MFGFIRSGAWEALHADATMACRALIATAKELWREIEGDYRDDITVRRRQHHCITTGSALTHC